MMRLPREPNAGERPKASDMRLILRYLRSITPLSTPTVKARITSNGCFLDAAPASTPAKAVATPHAYTVYDASDAATPKIGVTPGTHNGVTPTISGSPMNVKIGTPPAYPVLTLGGSDTLAYFQIDYNPGGSIVSIEIKSGTTLPTASISSGAAGSDYKLLSTLAITYAAVTGNASVACFNDAVSGPQGYAQCYNGSTVWLL